MRVKLSLILALTLLGSCYRTVSDEEPTNSVCVQQSDPFFPSENRVGNLGTGGGDRGDSNLELRKEPEHSVLKGDKTSDEE